MADNINNIDIYETNKVNIQNNDVGKIAYLAQIQSTINRMSTISTTFKGFSITFLAGIIAIIFSINGNFELPLIILIYGVIITLACFDTWYLKMEKRYRKLYDNVRNGIHPIDFDMSNDKNIKVKYTEALKSKAIWLFYLILIVISTLVIVLYIH